jgi:hypothetical protein
LLTDIEPERVMLLPFDDFEVLFAEGVAQIGEVPGSNPLRAGHSFSRNGVQR